MWRFRTLNSKINNHLIYNIIKIINKNISNQTSGSGREFYTKKIFENFKIESSPDSCVKCYTMFLPFLLIKIDVFS